MFESLRFRDFRWVWLGTFASFMAMSMQLITRGWLVLRLSGDSPLALSLIMMAFVGPMTIMSPIGGALADRVPRKIMIMVSQSGNATITLLLATLDMTGAIVFWHLIVLGMVNGSLVALNMPSRQALISDIVPGDKLMNAIALNNSGMNLTRVVGPALAGILIVYLNTAGVFYIIAGMFAFSALTISMVQIPKALSSTHTRKSVAADIREGLSYAAKNPTLRGLILVACIASLFGFPYLSLLPAWAREALDVQSDGLGLLLGIMGMGSLVGSLILASMKNFSRRGTVLLLHSLFWGIALVLFAKTTSYRTAAPFLLAIGFFSAVFMSLNLTLMQTYASRQMQGRIMSITMMTFGLMPLSGLPFGAMAERMGTPNALALSGSLLAIVSIVLFFAYPRVWKTN